MPTVLQWIVGIVGVGGPLAGFGWVFTTRHGNRKTNAETTVMLVDSASKYALDVTKQIQEISAAFNKYRTEQDQRWARADEDRRRESREQERLFRVHMRWDDDVAERLHDLGVPVPAPPPLYVETGD